MGADFRGVPRAHCEGADREIPATRRKPVELDALDPSELRERVERIIRDQIDFKAWDRCKAVEKVELQSLIDVMESWGR
jgi:hypothetical protein